MEVRDRFSLMAFGLKRKSAWQTKKAVLDTVFELKRRMRVVLYTWMSKREEKKFQDLQDLILTFDKKPGYKEKFDIEMAKRPKLSTMRPPKVAVEAVAMKDEMPLGTVNEEAEDDLEQSTNRLSPSGSCYDFSAKKAVLDSKAKSNMD